MNVGRLLEGALAISALVVGALLFIYSPELVRGWAFTIPGTTDVALEPVFFPRLSAVLICASSLILLITIPMRSGSLPASETSKEAYIKVGAGLAGILIYLGSILYVGFVVSTVLFIIGGSRVGGYKNWKAIVSTALLVAVGLRLIFRYGLHVNLPEGILF
jgi:hypothetical protein